MGLQCQGLSPRTWRINIWTENTHIAYTFHNPISLWPQHVANSFQQYCLLTCEWINDKLNYVIFLCSTSEYLKMPKNLK